MYKLKNAIIKECLLMVRDFGGLIIIFLMPLLLIITVTLIQDSTFKNFDDTAIPIILIDKDRGEVSKNIRQNILKSKTFEIVNQNFDEKSAQKAVFQGDYQLAIVIPENLSKDLDRNISYRVQQIVDALGYSVATDSTAQKLVPSKAGDIQLYFDPATNLSFKNGVKNAIDKMVFQIENQKIYTAFEDQLGADGSSLKNEKLISFKEISPKGREGVKPSSVQHNVPAWALFAIFLVVIPLSINLVKEKQQGTVMRLHTSPTPYLVHLLGKTFTFLLVCLVQFLLMVAVGVFIFPLIGLKAFEVGGRLPMLLFITMFAGLAAIGFSILVGTVAKTQEQSAPFGATAVVIMAAIGGIWVPVFMMPDFMQKISKFSPMNWGLEAYYNVLLRDTGLAALMPQLALLLAFYMVTVAIAIVYDKRKQDV